MPRRHWSRLEPPLPISRAAFLSGIATLSAGFAVGVPGFFAYAAALSSENNRWMLDQFGRPGGASDAAALVPYAVSPLSLLLYLFFTGRGLFSTYLVVSGTVRAAAAWFDDAQGDWILTAADWSASKAFTANAANRSRVARERREGREAPDVLKTGRWAGIEADYVLLSSRRKSEWGAGAIIMSDDDWYRLGTAFDIETPAGLRTAYPLTKLEAIEVLRRGIVYQLPPLRRSHLDDPHPAA